MARVKIILWLFIQTKKCMLISTRQKQQKSQTKHDLYIGNNTVQQVKTHQLLDIHIDCKLNLHSHINNLTERVSQNVFRLSKLKKYVNCECLKLFLMLISSRINITHQLVGTGVAKIH